MNWLEVSMTVNGELAEAVADVLARFAPNGVTTEQAVKYNDAEDEGTPIGPITVRAYLPADEKLEDNRQRLEESLAFLGMIQPLPKAVFTPLTDQNWMEAWKVRYQPIPIGKKLIIVPAWLESPDKARTPIRIDPGMAFGTGTHPTTQLCLEFVEQFVGQTIQAMEGRTPAMIDVGCGSGILSIAALKLGLGFVLGVDIDEAALRASRENALANGIAPEKFELGLGSVQEILAGKFLVRQAPLVMANILAPVLVRLFEAGMAELLSPGGAIILSGILEDQAQAVSEAAQAHGLVACGRKQLEDWVALAFSKPG
jgi:ribosomal protein L11 methyltransferase